MDSEARWRLGSSPFLLFYTMGSSTVFVWRQQLCKTVTGGIDDVCWRGWLQVMLAGRARQEAKAELCWVQRGELSAKVTAGLR